MSENVSFFFSDRLDYEYIIKCSKSITAINSVIYIFNVCIKTKTFFVLYRLPATL